MRNRVPRFLSRRTVLAACLVAGLLGLAGCVQGTVPASSEATEITRQATATSQATAVPSTQPANASAADLEDRLGVQVTLVAVTAGGGLLDLRFQVTDPAGAAELFGPENAPAVIAPERTSLSPAAMAALMLPEEHVQLGGMLAQHSQQHSRPDYLMVPFILYNLAPGERALMAAGMPAAVTQQLVPGPWKEKWAVMAPFLLA